MNYNILTINIAIIFNIFHKQTEKKVSTPEYMYLKFPKLSLRTGNFSSWMWWRGPDELSKKFHMSIPLFSMNTNLIQLSISSSSDILKLYARKLNLINGNAMIYEISYCHVGLLNFRCSLSVQQSKTDSLIYFNVQRRDVH